MNPTHNDIAPRILIGIGANLPAAGFTAPHATCLAAIQALAYSAEIKKIRVSPWYHSAPVPASDQPWFVNAVIGLDTDMPPPSLMQLLHAVEQQFGRQRQERNAARCLDLDLLDYMGLVQPDSTPTLPHPRLGDRAFVLLPLRDLCPNWRHPVTGQSVQQLIQMLPQDQAIQPMPMPL